MLSSGGSLILPSDGLADYQPTRANQQYYANSGLQLTTVFAAYGELYRTQPWVYTLVRKLGTSTSRLPLKTYLRSKDGSRSEQRDSAYGQLLRRPNPRMGGKALWLWTASTRELYGEAIWLKLRDDRGAVRELHPLHPTNILVRRAGVNSTMIGWDGTERDVEPGVLIYTYAPGARMASRVVEFLESDIVHFRSYNPNDLVRGLSPCEPLRQTLLSEDAARRGQSALWRNGARPSVALSTDKTLTDGAITRLSAQWDQKHSGIEQWGKTAVLEEGLKPISMQITPGDMEYVTGRQLNRDECCAVWDVPPPAVHILDHATFSNITEQMRSLYRESMGPRLNDYEDTLDTQLRPDFDPAGDIYAEFMLDEVLRGSLEARAAAQAQLVQTGQRTPNEGRRLDNLPDLPGGDALLVNAALIPLTEVRKLVDKPGAGDLTIAPQKVKSLTTAEARTLTGRLSRTVAPVDIDLDALCKGVEGDTDPVRGLVAAAVARGTDIATLRRQIAGAALDSEELT